MRLLVLPCLATVWLPASRIGRPDCRPRAGLPCAGHPVAARLLLTQPPAGAARCPAKKSMSMRTRCGMWRLLANSAYTPKPGSG